jgi:phosphoenolpyruvate carboxylase
MQSRHGLPGWFGVGYALNRFSDPALLRLMMDRFPFFADMFAMSRWLSRNPISPLPGSIQNSFPMLLCVIACFGLVEEEFTRTRDVVSSRDQSAGVAGNEPCSPAFNPASLTLTWIR